MTKSKIAAGIGAAVGMLILILDGKTAFTGAAEGIDLCIRTVIPSLFPFFVLSSLLTSAFLGNSLPFSLPIVPKGAESLLLTGFLGGYPVGAQSIAHAYRSGQLPKEQAERMLAFCNNAGPSFLFGMIAPMFPSPKYAWLLWGIHIISALAVALLMPKPMESVQLSQGKSTSISDAVGQAVRVMAQVCGWIVLFRVGLTFLERWFFWILPIELQVFLSGLLELSNGCVSLSLVEDTELRFLICAAMLGFGGLCVTMQTVSVTHGLSLRYYFPGKIMQTGISVFLVWLILPKEALSPAIVGVALTLAAISGVFLRKMQNNSSIPRLVGV